MSFRRLHVLRAFAWLLAGLVLAGRLLGMAHAGQVVHRACAEHGELVEVAQATLAEAGLPRGDLGEGPALGEVVAYQDHAHEHCIVAGHERLASALGTGSPAVGEAAIVGLHIIAPGDVPPRTGLPLFRLAPKNSPPV